MKRFQASNTRTLVVIACALLAVLCARPAHAFNYTTDVTNLIASQLGVGPLNFSVITGYVPLDWYFGDSSETGIFFELITKFGEKLDTVSPSTPIIAWFQGGPGGPSQFGSWAEFGPVEALSNTTLALRENSWSDTAMLLFIDQPLQVGGSWTSNGTEVNTTEQAGKYMTNFFYNFFFQLYPQFKANPFYMFGESYGGHYVPQFAFDLFTSSQFPIDLINFKGVAIGDGLTYATLQLSTFGEYTFQASIASSAQARDLQDEQVTFQELQVSGQYANAMHYSDQIQSQIVNWTQTSIYNFMQYSNPPPYPAWFDNWSSWIIANRVAYGIAPPVPDSQIAGNNDMFTWFEDSGDIGKNFRDRLDYLLTRTNVLIYNGQLDILINAPGVYEFVSTLAWQGVWPWNRSQKALLTLGNAGQQVIGNYKTYSNLTVAIVYDAGHLLPTDQPAAAHQLMYNYVNGLFN